MKYSTRILCDTYRDTRLFFDENVVGYEQLIIDPVDMGYLLLTHYSGNDPQFSDFYEAEGSLQILMIFNIVEIDDL